MSIFSRIKDAIFGHSANAKSATTSASSTAKPSPTGGASRPTSPSPQQPSATSPATSGQSTSPAAVDIEQVLTAMSKDNAQQLNWRTSIVDLMKLIGIDPSLQNRKELAHELGYEGDSSDSAAMNMWLHKRVMQELSAHGGKVPPELKG